MDTPLPFSIIYKVKIYTPEKSYTIPKRSYMNHTFTDKNRVVSNNDLKINFDFNMSKSLPCELCKYSPELYNFPRAFIFYLCSAVVALFL